MRVVIGAALVVMMAVPARAEERTWSSAMDVPDTTDPDDEEQPEEAPRRRKVREKRSKQGAKARELATPVEAAPAATLPPARPWWSGISAEALAGGQGSPTPVDSRRAFTDRFLGARVGYRRTFSFITVGGEFTFRSMSPAMSGSQPVIPLALTYKISGNALHQGIRWQNMVAAGATLSYAFTRIGVLIEPALVAGVGLSYRQFAMQLDPVFAYNRSFFTVGPYGGASLLLGVLPIYGRWEAVYSYEVGRPPFTTRIPTLVTTLSVGMRL